MHRAASACLGALMLAILSCATWSPAMGAEGRRRIYFLESLAPTQPVAIRTIEAFKRRLGEKSTESFEIFIDYMDLARFPGPAHVERTVRYLKGKYAEAPPAVLIPLGRGAVPFMLQYRKLIAPGVPVIMTSVPTRTARETSGLDNAVWVVTDYDFAKTLELARRLQPKARQIVVISGTSDYDRMWLDDARRDLEPYRDRYDTRYLVDLPYDELLAQVSRLPPDTIVMMSSFFKDGNGLSHTAPEVVAAVSGVSGAPVYAPFGTYLGGGIVGGYMDSYEAHGVAAADLALDILSGKSTAELDRITRALHQYHADARQLNRWGFSARRLPPGTVVSFRTPSLWDEHRVLVLTAVVVLFLQSGLVVGLLMQRRRRRGAELQARESEERLLSTAASANVGLWQLDREADALWMTEHCRTLFRLPGNVALTRESLMTTIHPEDRKLAMSSLQAAADPHVANNIDVRILSTDGNIRWISIRTRAASEGPEPKQLRGVFVDINEQKVAEGEVALRREEVAQLKRVREHEGRLITMNAMSASIVHEISQPVGAMMAGAEAALLWLARAPPDLDNVRVSVERVAVDGRRAGEVIASVRKLFRRDGGGTETIDVDDIVREVLAIEQDECQRQRILVGTELAGVAKVSCDRTQLHQVVLNLVTNAVQAMSAVTGGPRELRVSTAVRPRGHVMIAVEDSGVGIDRDNLDRIFEAFFTTKSRGMGLGLWLCRRIVENHRGRLTASSEVGRGSRFEIVLPAANLAVATSPQAHLSPSLDLTGSPGE